jgi:Holliday junction resolvase-like predicted endonuclease
MLAQQNNSSAAINNLRRGGARRVELKDETQRIEHNVAKLFRDRSFKVVVGYQPVKVDGYDPGEVDLICVLDGYVLVIEVKSTFLRNSKKEAWIHRTSTLRKAGMQLLRKTEAVEQAISEDADLRASLSLDSGYRPHRFIGWIVDTSIECDHSYFSGFLKVSLEEVLIALRDDAFLLNDPDGLFNGLYNDSDDSARDVSTLYPDGFSVRRFLEIIGKQTIWA